MDYVTKTVAETLNTDRTTAFGIIIALLVVLFTLMLIGLILWTRGKKGKNTVLLVGLSDAGKTLMFLNFVTGSTDTVSTYTSMKENSFEGAEVGSTKVDLVDIPGADKVRKRILDSYLATKGGRTVKAIVFVIDSATYPKMSKDVAECLYDVLCEAPKKTPMLVACNKQDLPLAKSAKVIRTNLEKEFALLNRSRAAALASTDERSGDSRKMLMKEGKELSWDSLGRKIDFCECYAKREGGEEEATRLNQVEEWLVAV